MLDGGIARLRRLARDGRVTDIALPFDGTLSSVHHRPAARGRAVRAHRLAHPVRHLVRRRRRARHGDRAYAPARHRRQRLPEQAPVRHRPRRHEGPLRRDPPEGPEARRQHAGVDIRLRLLRAARVHAGLCRAHARAGGRRLHRRLCVRARRRGVRARLAQGRAACQQAQHLARPHRRVPRPVREEVHRAGPPGDRRPLGRRRHGRARAHRAAGPVRRGHRRRRLVQPAALRGRAERLR